MPTKPRVHEIFSNKTPDFRFDNKEVREQLHLKSHTNNTSGNDVSHKKGPAPQPPFGMKKFGGYKPRILGGEEDSLAVEINNNKTTPDSSGSNNNVIPRAPPLPPSFTKKVELTKPKPWVVGDKNVPMILGGLPREDESASSTVEGRPGHTAARDSSSWSVSDDTSTLVSNSSSTDQLGMVNPAFGSFNPLPSTVDQREDVMKDVTGNGFGISRLHEGQVNPSYTPDSLQGPADSSHTIGSSLDIVNSQLLAPDNSQTPADNNIVSIPDPIQIHSPTVDAVDTSDPTQLDSDYHVYDEVIRSEDGGVFIPEPDYDEDEKTLDLYSEDEASEEESNKDRQKEEGVDTPSSKPPPHPRQTSVQPRPSSFYIGHYEGEDLSHYLSDDEADGLTLPPPFMSDPVSTGKYKSKKSTSKKQKAETLPVRPKVSQRHLLFKDAPAPTSGQVKQHNTKRKGKSPAAPAFNTVRNFSFADSKYGTNLRTRGNPIGGRPVISAHFSPEPDYDDQDDNELFLSANANQSYESFLRYRHGQSVESSDSGVELDDLNGAGSGPGVWKKLTWRLKNKTNRNQNSSEQF